jgi:fatty acid desaturase
VAVVAARVDDLERGALPAICAKTGVPCDVLVKDRLKVVPSWVPPLAVLLIVPYFVARAYASRNIDTKLPIAPAHQERIRRLVRFAWVALVVAAAGLAASLFGAGTVSLIALLVGLVAYVVIVYIGDQMWVGARPGPTPAIVILTRVHPEFARALAYWDASASE